jgi:hypothetical protein
MLDYKMKKFVQMSSEDGKKFFTLDLAERMIRVEQEVSSSFDRAIPYYQTEYYKNLSLKQQKELSRFIKNKKQKNFVKLLIFILPLLGFLVIRTGMNARAVDNMIGQGIFIVVYMDFLACFFCLSCSIFFFLYLKKKNLRE